MDYKDILYNYAEYFEQSDVASNVIRWIGWQIIKLLHGICDMCQGLWEAAQALDFTKTFADKLGVYYPIWSAIFLITICSWNGVSIFRTPSPFFEKLSYHNGSSNAASERSALECAVASDRADCFHGEWKQCCRYNRNHKCY